MCTIRSSIVFSTCGRAQRIAGRSIHPTARHQLTKPAQNGIGLCRHRHFGQCLASQPVGDFGQATLLPSGRCSRPLTLARRIRFSTARYSSRASSSLSTFADVGQQTGPLPFLKLPNSAPCERLADQHRTGRQNACRLGARETISPTFRSRFAHPSRRCPIPWVRELSTVEWQSAH